MISVFSSSTPGPRKLGPSIVAAASWIMLIGGMLSVAYAGYVITEAKTYQKAETHKLEQAKLREVMPLPQPPVMAEGDVIGEIQVSRLGLKAIVVQGDSPRILRQAVGHISETALPGETGNIVLAAHRDTFFRPLRQIQPGDVITLETVTKRFRYEVESAEIVSPRKSGISWDSPRRELTLITCYPFSYVGPAPDRFIVHAHEIAALP